MGPAPFKKDHALIYIYILLETSTIQTIAATNNKTLARFLGTLNSLELWTCMFLPLNHLPITLK
jgi:hypothetical protein